MKKFTQSLKPPIEKSEIEEEFQKRVTETISVSSSNGSLDCVVDDEEIDSSVLESIDSFDIRQLGKLILKQTLSDRKTIKNILKELIAVARMSDNPGLWFPVVQALSGVSLPTKNIVKLIETLSRKEDEDTIGKESFSVEEIAAVVEGVEKESQKLKNEKEKDSKT